VEKRGSFAPSSSANGRHPIINGRRWWAFVGTEGSENGVITLLVRAQENHDEFRSAT